MSVEVTVVEKKEEKDIFYRDNYVISEKGKIVHVTMEKYTNDHVNSFGGVIVKNPLDDESYLKAGTFDSAFSCKYFKQFHGKITIEVG